MRIRGAILDEIRALDWVPRLVRSRCRQLDTASKELEAELGRPPKDDELATRLNLSRAAIAHGDYRAVGMMSLSAQRNDSDGDSEGTEQAALTLADEKTPDPAREAQRRFLKQMLTRGLSRAERLVVTLYYYEEMTMKEIGQTLDLSESRVSQMHTEILKRLRVLTGDADPVELQQAAAA
jgi:RNA polymerase sigma factor for flagellar operon FliA